MRTHTLLWSRMALAISATVTVIGTCTSQAKAAAALWISAPNWSYSAAAADSPVGWAYFWGLSVGPGSYSFAYAFSNDGAGNAGYAFAEAAVGRGGMGAVQVAGLADPWAGDSIDINLIDPSDHTGYPSTDPGSSPFSSSPSYTVSPTGITFTGSGQELGGEDEIQAFVYNGNTDMASLEAALGAASSGGNSSSGDVTDMGTLASDFGLTPLDDPILDPSSLSSLNFTENDSSVDTSKVILVGMSTAPEPTALALVGLTGIASLWRRRRVAA